VKLSPSFEGGAWEKPRDAPRIICHILSPSPSFPKIFPSPFEGARPRARPAKETVRPSLFVVKLNHFVCLARDRMNPGGVGGRPRLHDLSQIDTSSHTHLTDRLLRDSCSSGDFPVSPCVYVCAACQLFFSSSLRLDAIGWTPSTLKKVRPGAGLQGVAATGGGGAHLFVPDWGWPCRWRHGAKLRRLIPYQIAFPRF